MGFIQLENSTQEQVVRVISQDCFTPNSHLDIGCGEAEFLAAMSQHFDYSLGIDNDLNLVIQNSKHLPNFNFEYFNVNTSFPEGKFSFISCNLVIAFIRDKQSFLFNVKNALEENGIFLLSTPVTIKGIEFSRYYRAISVDFESTIKLLRANFSGYYRFAAEKSSHNRQRITWLLSDNPGLFEIVR